MRAPQKLDLSPGNLLVSRSIQRLDLHERLTLIRQVRLPLSANMNETLTRLEFSVE